MALHHYLQPPNTKFNTTRATVPFHGRSFISPFSNRRVYLAASQMSNNPGHLGHEKYRNQHHRELFTGEFRRQIIEVPNIVLQLDTEEVLSGKNVLRLVEEAVSKWVGILVLSGGEGSGGRLYQSACLLKSVVGDRAHLMISERVDIAAAVGASGVVLSDQGLPTIVARNSMVHLIPDTAKLPLIGRVVLTCDFPVHASSFEGADFLIQTFDQEKQEELLRNSLFKNLNLPIFVAVSRYGGMRNVRASFLVNGASGLVVSLEELRILHDIGFGQVFHGIPLRNKRKCHSLSACDTSEVMDVDDRCNTEIMVGNFETMEDKEKHLIGVERLVLLEAINVIQAAAPMMEEVSLITDAASQLGEPFLLAVVGEFNSGKSTLINALLGRRYLKDGVIPTTNEVTFLHYREFSSNWEQHYEKHPDGRLICYLPVPILKEMNMVDTPGTNVILQRQQCMTEEFVPRADLLLFVMSADRPFTESEVIFLRYTQKWKKKVVFVLNKSDTYQNLSEMKQGISFVKKNAQTILSTEDVALFPVSARYALEAKLLALFRRGKVHGKPSFFYSHWKDSGFEELESFLSSFLDFSTSAGLERMKLKLETPIRIADRVLSACEDFVFREIQNAEDDLSLAYEIINFSEEFAAKMQIESNSWKKQTLLLIDSAKTRVIKIVESILRLSNFELLAFYMFGGDQFRKAHSVLFLEEDILTTTYSSAHKLLEEYSNWLMSVTAREKSLCKESFSRRWPSFVTLDKQAQQEVQDLRDNKHNKHCIKMIGDFSIGATSRLFEREVHEMFLQTFGGLGVAGLSAVVLTSVTQNMLEDLLALTLCSTGGFLAIASFPIRRQKMVNKITKIADTLAQQLQDAMDQDLHESVEDMENFLKDLVRPCQDAAQQRLHKFSTLQCKLSDVTQKLTSLKIQIQNLHLPQ